LGAPGGLEKCDKAKDRMLKKRGDEPQAPCAVVRAARQGQVDRCPADSLRPRHHRRIGEHVPGAHRFWRNSRPGPGTRGSPAGKSRNYGHGLNRVGPALFAESALLGAPNACWWNQGVSTGSFQRVSSSGICPSSKPPAPRGRPSERRRPMSDQSGPTRNLRERRQMAFLCAKSPFRFGTRPGFFEIPQLVQELLTDPPTRQLLLYDFCRPTRLGVLMRGSAPDPTSVHLRGWGPHARTCRYFSRVGRAH